MSSRAAVFLDRDGTINVDDGYVHRVEDLELMPGAADAIARLNEAGALVIVVSNQSGIAHGHFDEDDLGRFHDALRERLAASGARLDAIYWCPHHPDGTRSAYARSCDGRKPGIGMFLRARREMDFDPGRSWMVGDRPSDMEFARRAGLRGVLLRPPDRDAGAEAGTDQAASGIVIAPDLAAAADVIVAELAATVDVTPQSDDAVGGTAIPTRRLNRGVQHEKK